LTSKNYFLVSSHRQENIDKPERLNELVSALNLIADHYKLPIIVSTHPRTRDRLDELKANLNPLIIFCKPFGFFDYNKLQLEARAVLSDSGSVSEESAILGFPAITIRDSMERPEALEAGSILMSGLNSSRVLQAIEFLENTLGDVPVPEDYLINNTSERVLNYIQSTFHVRDFWSGKR
jgi:UDP-N-acetylglucosamine 2-epimerase (non-hydrolysing)